MKISVQLVVVILFFCYVLSTNISAHTILNNRLSIPLTRAEVTDFFYPQHGIRVDLFLGYLDSLFRTLKTEDDVIAVMVFTTYMDGAFSEGILEYWQEYISKNQSLFTQSFIKGKKIALTDTVMNKQLEEFKSFIVANSRSGNEASLYKRLFP